MIKTIKVTVNEKTVVPTKPTAPKTGDTKNLGLWGMTLLASSSIVALLSKKKRLFK